MGRGRQADRQTSRAEHATKHGVYGGLSRVLWVIHPAAQQLLGRTQIHQQRLLQLKQGCVPAGRPLRRRQLPAAPPPHRRICLGRTGSPPQTGLSSCRC